LISLTIVHDLLDFLKQFIDNVLIKVLSLLDLGDKLFNHHYRISSFLYNVTNFNYLELCFILHASILDTNLFLHFLIVILLLLNQIIVL